VTINRRKFLKTVSASCLAVAAGPVLTHGFSLPGRMSPGPKELKAKRWGMVVDMRKCDGNCTEDCIGVCHEIHNVPYIPQAEHQVMWLFQEPYGNTFPDRSRELVSQNLKSRKFLLLCNHCDDPPCVRACPTQATFKRENDGIVMIDYHRCIGCRFCMAACPYGSRSFNFRDPRPYIKKIHPQFPTRRKGVVEKCNFCQERLEVGQLPACVETCKKGALIFGDLRDPSSEIRKILAQTHHVRRKPELGTRPSVFYIF